MPADDGERLARVETLLEGVVEKVSALQGEERRTRGRLHDLEGATKGLLELQRQKNRHERQRDRRLELRLQVLTVVIGAASLVTPLVLVLAHALP